MGTRGDDRLIGGNARDVLIGKAGDDFLGGGHGPDTLRGGRGDDILWTGKVGSSDGDAGYGGPGRRPHPLLRQRTLPA